MTLSEFKELVLDCYQLPVQEHWERSLVTGQRPRSGHLAYATLAIVTATPTHFIFELFGSSDRYQPWIVRQSSARTTATYFAQFETHDTPTGLRINGGHIVFQNFCLSQDVPLAAAVPRFVMVGQRPQFKFQLQEASVFSPEPECGPIYLRSCYILNVVGRALRAKYVDELLIVGRNFSKEELGQGARNCLALMRKGELPAGIHHVPQPSAERNALAAQFTSMFLTPGLPETTLGEFVRQHPLFIERAFGATNFLYEPSFPWIEGNSDTDEVYINPDLLIQRPDGDWNICDLKTAALSRLKLTKGRHKRRRFIDYVQEGVAQLCNYQDYFRYPRNVEAARNLRGITLHAPRLILVVGSYENASGIDIREALRAAPENVDIIDYDTLVALFRAGDHPERARDIRESNATPTHTGTEPTKRVSTD